MEENLDKIQAQVVKMQAEMTKLKKDIESIKKGQKYESKNKGVWGEAEKSGNDEKGGGGKSDWQGTGKGAQGGMGKQGVNTRTGNSYSEWGRGVKEDDGWMHEWKWEHDSGMYGKGGVEGPSEDKNRRDKGWEKRQTEMVVRRFERNSKWSEIKVRTEETLKRTGQAYDKVFVIGQIASVAILKSTDTDEKKTLETWLSTCGGEVKRRMGLWFGDKVGWEVRDKEAAVGKMYKAFMEAKPKRNDASKDYRKGTVFVRGEIVARWNDSSKK